MIVARFEKDDEKKRVTLRVKGHAGYAPKGMDIICASSSILSYALAQHFKFLSNNTTEYYQNPRIKMKSGDAIVSARARTMQGYGTLLNSCFLTYSGFLLLASNYSSIVAVEGFHDATEEDEEGNDQPSDTTPEA